MKKYWTVDEYDWICEDIEKDDKKEVNLDERFVLVTICSMKQS